MISRSLMLVGVAALAVLSSAQYTGPCSNSAYGTSGLAFPRGYLCVPYPSFNLAERKRNVSASPQLQVEEGDKPNASSRKGASSIAPSASWARKANFGAVAFSLLGNSSLLKLSITSWKTLVLVAMDPYSRGSRSTGSPSSMTRYPFLAYTAQPGKRVHSLTATAFPSWSRRKTSACTSNFLTSFDLKSDARKLFLWLSQVSTMSSLTIGLSEPSFSMMPFSSARPSW